MIELPALILFLFYAIGVVVISIAMIPVIIVCDIAEITRITLWTLYRLTKGFLRGEKRGDDDGEKAEGGEGRQDA